MVKKSKKTPRKTQKYEDYWKLTLEYTDFTSESFNKTLELIVNYIDEYEGKIDSEIYKKLQEDLNKITPKEDMASIRKAINQFLKLGFINNHMKSYHKKTKKFLAEHDKSRKRIIYSEIAYDNASFKRSFTREADVNELNFLIKTLEYCGSLSMDNLLGLMYQNINDYEKGYVTLDELKKITDDVLKNKADDRKYNQVRYLFGICKDVLCGVYINKNNCITLDKDEQVQEYIERKGRDSYKQRLYKYELYRESIELNNEIVCYFEEMAYPLLIASHIKPYSACYEDEQFDSDNGLLLSRSIDHLFDQGWITFKNDGTVVCADKLDARLKQKLCSKKLDIKYLKSNKRLEYLDYHRKNIFNKDKEYKQVF